MYVQVEIKLDVKPTSIHHEAMRTTALSLTNDKNSVYIVTPEGHDEVIIAEFTIPKARQMDVVDNIGRSFWFVENYQDSAIRFPKTSCFCHGRKSPIWIDIGPN
jgi:hypothetical protein